MEGEPALVDDFSGMATVYGVGVNAYDWVFAHQRKRESESVAKVNVEILPADESAAA